MAESECWVLENGYSGAAVRYRKYQPEGFIWVADVTEAMHFGKQGDAIRFCQLDDVDSYVSERVFDDDDTSGLPEATLSDADTLACPWCGYEHTDLWEWNLEDEKTSDLECEQCEQPIRVTMRVSVSYECEARAASAKQK